jgi:hypothetical protein
MGSLTDNQVATLILIERITASISVVGTLHILVTFICIKDFRTLSNTIIFYASFANLFANVAALIGGAALSNVSGALCQFQGFLLEMYDDFAVCFHYRIAKDSPGSCNQTQCGLLQWQSMYI